MGEQTDEHRQLMGRPTVSVPTIDQPIKMPGLHNLLRVSDRIYSGSEPHGDDGFNSLGQLGIKTVVSVDGARPDLNRAHAKGLRYVHIPIGYAGISAEASGLLARVVREGQSPFYIHCHHGQHRGPAAAAVACVASNSCSSEEALRILEVAGTGKNYTGLWRDVERYKSPADLAHAGPLVEVAEVKSFAALMAQIDRNYDNLKLCQLSEWSTPQDHPDITPAQEALLLKEGLRESRRHLSAGRDEQFVTWLTEAATLAEALEAAIRLNKTDQAVQQINRLDIACKRCHVKYRNEPTN